MDTRRFEFIPLLGEIKINDKIAIQISSVELYNNDIYLGTNDSFVICYKRLTFQATDVELKPYCYKYLGLKKPVSCMKISSILNRLLCVCDSTLLMLNLDNLDTINSFKVKNVSTFCINENPTTSDPFALELCIGKRKSITICLLQDNKLSVIKEMNLPEQPILLSMDGYYVCMASPENYYMIDWENGTHQLLCNNDSNSLLKPICKYIARNEFLINGASHLGVFVKSSGISERPPIDWGPDVSQIAYSYPYILCLKRHVVSIISVIDQQVKEEFLFENGSYIDNFDGRILVAACDSIFYLRRIPWEEQIDSLLENGKSQEAIELCHSLYESGLISNSDIELAKAVKVRAALRELIQANFSLAKSLLLSSDIEVETLLYCFSNIAHQLNLTSNIGNDTIRKLFEELSSKIASSLEDYRSFFIDILHEFKKSDKLQNIILINTAIFLIYIEDIATYLSDIELFFHSTNEYNFEVVEKCLKGQKLFYFLSICYSSRVDCQEKAIDLLKKLETKQISDPHYNYKGLALIADILRKCRNAHLIMSHIGFLLETNQSEAASVLISNTKMQNKSFPILNPECVVGLLHQYRKALTIYLEHLVLSLKVKTPSIHTNLAIVYIEIISLHRESEENSQLCDSMLVKLQSLLEMSDHYDKQFILTNLIKNGLSYEAAFLYGKMGNHKSAFEIYLKQHQDYERALKHCVRYADDGTHIFDMLFTEYMNMYHRNGPEQLKPLLDFLNNSKCQFDLRKTLPELSSSWLLDSVFRHLTNNVITLHNRRFHSSFGKELSRSQLERVKKEKQSLLVNRVHIDKNSVCLLCNAKLLESKFVWIPGSQAVLHDFCYLGSQQTQ